MYQSKHLFMKTIALFTVSLFAFFILNAQEEKKSEIHVKIEKDGKVVKDTTYLVDEDTDTKVASKILDMTFGENMHHREGLRTFSSEDGAFYEFHSKDGKMTAKHKVMMKEMHEGEDGHVFITTEEGEDGEKIVIVKKINIDEDGEHTWTNKEKNVYIIKEGEYGELKHIRHDGEKPVWIEEDGAKVMIIDSKDGKQKKIEIIIEEDMDLDSDSEQIIKTKDGETIIIRTIKEGDNEKEVKVEVIVEEEKQEGDKKEIKKRKKKK